MRERKLTLFQCSEVEHNVRVTYHQQLDTWKRKPIHQTILHCSYKTENLCKLDFYPADGESRCYAVKLAKINQFK